MLDKNLNPIGNAVDEDIKVHETGKQDEKLFLHNTGRTEIRKYLFEFSTDEKTYSIAFEGKIAQADISGIVESLRNQLYENCGGVILSYMEDHHLEFSHFKISAIPLKHKETMRRAEYLLKSFSVGTAASPDCVAGNYYAIIDHQEQINEHCHEGCYCALSRVQNNETCHYRIVGQIFSYNRCTDHADGYFAIRASDGGQPLRNIAVKSGEPVLPVFGCVDVTGLLLNIDRISTARQSMDISVR